MIALLGPTGAFTTLAPSSLPGVGRRGSSLAASSRRPDVVVISPPGGIGEITCVQAARLGGCVKWFVVSAPSPTTPGGGRRRRRRLQRGAQGRDPRGRLQGRRGREICSSSHSAGASPWCSARLTPPKAMAKTKGSCCTSPEVVDPSVGRPDAPIPPRMRNVSFLLGAALRGRLFGRRNL